MSMPRCIQAAVPQISVLSPTLYNLYINDTLQIIGVNLALFADDTCLYATERKEGYVLRKVQRVLNSLSAWCEGWNTKINEDKTQAIYFSHQRRPPDSLLTLNGRNIPFVNSVKYLVVIFDKRIIWRLHIETFEAKAFRTFIKLYSLLKNERLSVNIKLALHKALIRSVMTYLVPLGNSRQKPIYWNCSACKIRLSAPMVIPRGAHRSAICMWLSKFRTFTTT
jgi:hypothetical protein